MYGHSRLYVSTVDFSVIFVMETHISIRQLPLFYPLNDCITKCVLLYQGDIGRTGQCLDNLGLKLGLLAIYLVASETTRSPHPDDNAVT